MSEWTAAEKRKLLAALEKYGNDVHQIQKVFPDKSAMSIRGMFDKYGQLAAVRMNEEERRRGGDSAINQWIDILKKQRTKSGIVDILPRALKYIALYETRPIDPDVNLRNCYTTLSELSNGLVTKTLEPSTSHFLYSNLTRLASRMNSANLTKRKEFVRNLKSNSEIKINVRTYKEKRIKPDYCILNPLNVPDELLTTRDENE